MKALIRNEGETVKESDGIEGIDWKTGAPLTSEYWAGGAYRLIENYIEPVESEGEIVEEPIQIVKEEEPIQTEELYEFSGKMYTAKELKELLGSL